VIDPPARLTFLRARSSRSRQTFWSFRRRTRNGRRTVASSIFPTSRRARACATSIRNLGRRWGECKPRLSRRLLLRGGRGRRRGSYVAGPAGHCHRGAVIADIRKDGCKMRVVGTHLSLTQILRIAQMRTLGQHLLRRRPRPTILCGDLNEWRPWGGLAFSRSVLGDRFTGPAPPTFPVRRPILPLDRVLAAGSARFQRRKCSTVTAFAWPPTIVPCGPRSKSTPRAVTRPLRPARGSSGEATLAERPVSSLSRRQRAGRQRHCRPARSGTSGASPAAGEAGTR
jgi:hypothetical protein